jgi:diguanylate cyclase (GGDEF)-like protein/PAS domain S-box-containing protein
MIYAMPPGRLNSARIVYVNESFTQLTGYSADEVIGQSPYFNHRSPADQEIARDILRSLPRDRKTASLEIETVRKDGSTVWLEVVLAPVRNVRGRVTDVIAYQRDITELRRLQDVAARSSVPQCGRCPTSVKLREETVDRRLAQDRLLYAASHDRLTGLGNRPWFLERLRERLSAGQFDAVAVLLIDLDRFKLINDSHGHAVGDELLAAIARRLEANVAEGDLLARADGDAFLMMVSRVEDEASALSAAERSLTLFAAPFSVGGSDLYLTPSIGVAVSSVGVKAEELLRNADIAMFHAKSLGKNRCLLFNSEHLARVARAHLIEMELRKALERRQLGVAYQPILSMATGRLSGFEVLARWDHPFLGIVRPDEFIAVAEDTGLIVPLGRHVMREACAQLQRWDSLAPAASSLSMSVNVSTSQLVAPADVVRIGELLEEFRLDASRLVVEVTETKLATDAVRAATTLRLIRDLGVRVHMDDFGTGYCSLSYLHEFAIDALKIDRGFVSGKGDGLANPRIVETVLALARDFGMSVTAEGIETAEQERELRALGCQFGQGYLYAKPLSAADATEWVVAETSAGVSRTAS